MLDEPQKNYGFFDDELEEIALNTDDTLVVTDDDKEDFGFFDDVPSLSSDSVMESNSIEEVKTVEVTPSAPVAKATPVVEKKTETAAAPARAARKPKEETATTKKSATTNNIRVNLDKIDLLMNNVGDLVITNAMLTQFSTSIEEVKTRNAVLERLELLPKERPNVVVELIKSFLFQNDFQ